jgi:hypothetical protein
VSFVDQLFYLLIKYIVYEAKAAVKFVLTKFWAILIGPTKKLEIAISKQASSIKTMR